MLNFFTNISIRYKLIVTFSSFAELVGLFVFFFFPYQQRKQILNQAKGNAWAISKMTADNLATSLEFWDYTTAYEVLNVLKEKEDFEFAIIQDENFTPFTSINPERAKQLDLTENRQDRSYKIIEDISVITFPILSRGNKVGILTLGLSLEKIQSEISQNNTIALLVSTALVLVLIFSSAIIGNIITKPIHKVIDVSSKIAQGDFSSRLEVSSKDEVGKLATAFNEMSMKLNKSIGELEKSEEKYHKLIEFADVGIIVSNNSKIIQINKKAEEIYGYSKEGIIGQPTSILTLDKYRRQHREMLDEILRYGKAKKTFFEEEGVRKDRSIFPIEISYSLSESREKEDHNIIAIVRDITERKQDEEKTQASLREKEVLLKEIHHRVKNNMQVISSLLKLQSGYINDQKDLELFKESQNRIQAMALIHEKLYQSRDLVNIDYAEYIKNLTNGLIRSYGSGANRIALKTDIVHKPLGVDSAIPCGLIINELVSNSLKHAFPEGREGEIWVLMHPIDEDGTELIVRDNGIGVSPDFDFRHTESLGLQLVTTLTESQLRGSIELKNNEGTAFHIKFKELKYKKRI